LHIGFTFFFGGGREEDMGLKQKEMNEVFLLTMIADDERDLLLNLLESIGKWKEIASKHLDEYALRMEEQYSGYDWESPVRDRAFMEYETVRALYGSLAVNIAAYGESISKTYWEQSQITEKLTTEITFKPRVFNPPLQNGKQTERAKKASFYDYIWSLCKPEKKEDPRQQLAHYDSHCFVRELSNCFKHHGGTVSQKLLDDFGSRDGVGEVGSKIAYESLPWTDFIQQTNELLRDLAVKSSAKRRKETEK
jgi:hypothetical protein